MCCCRLLFSLIALPGTRLTALPVSIPSVLLCPTRVAVLLAVSLSAVQRVSQCCFPPETERQRQPTLLPSRRHHGRLLLRPHTTKPAHRLPRLLIAFSRPPSARNHIDAAIIHTRPHAPPRAFILLTSHTSLPYHVCLGHPTTTPAAVQWPPYAQPMERRASHASNARRQQRPRLRA
jgi:hypothetical protein